MMVVQLFIVSCFVWLLIFFEYQEFIIFG